MRREKKEEKEGTASSYVPDRGKGISLTSEKKGGGEKKKNPDVLTYFGKTKKRAFPRLVLHKRGGKKAEPGMSSSCSGEKRGGRRRAALIMCQDPKKEKEKGKSPDTL